jgi:hypothetical protein
MSSLFRLLDAMNASSTAHLRLPPRTAPAQSVRPPNWGRKNLTNTPEWHWMWLLRYMRGESIREISTSEGVEAPTVRVVLAHLGVRFDYRRVHDPDIPSEARHAFSTQRCSALTRGVGWDLDLATWWHIWSASGRWAQRGKGPDKYVMARAGDTGPYAVGNVRICTMLENMRESSAVRRARRVAAYAPRERARP